MAISRRRTGDDAPRIDAHYCLFDSAVGVCGIAWSGQGVTRLLLPEADRATTERRLRGSGLAHGADKPPPRVARAIAKVRRHLDGSRVDLADIALDLSDSIPFHRKVYEALRGIGWGETVSYGTLAGLAGAPGAARAVGTALKHSPVAIIIPCHRVVAAGGKVGGYTAHGGLVTKRRLLEIEGVRI
jgi:methylated-DNA-[protein]-cysteine S-methyltransferase